MSNPPVGRGGRGAALAQLLSQQVRRPGDAPAAISAQQQQPGLSAQPQTGFTQPTAAFAAQQSVGTVQPSGPTVTQPAGASGGIPLQPSQPAEPATTSLPQQPSLPSAAIVKPGSGRGALIQRLISSASSSSPGSSMAPTPYPPSEPPSADTSRPQSSVAGISKPVTPAMQSVSPGASLLSAASPMDRLSAASMQQLAYALPTPSPALSEPDVGGSGDARGRGTYLERFVSDLGSEKAKEPKIGKIGETVQLSTNYIAVRCRNTGVYQYCVGFRPEVDSLFMRHKLLESDDMKQILGEVKAFDGRILFLPVQLQNEETIMTVKQPTDQKPVAVTIRLTKVLPPESCLQLYNITFRKALSKLRMCQVGRDYYLPQAAAPVPQHRLEVWPGYITAIDRYEGGLLMLTDVKHRVLRTQTVLEIILECIRANQATFKSEACKRLIGCVVLTRYNNKTYRIDDIDWNKSPSMTFDSADGTTMSFVDYYKVAYNKEITEPRQPLLIHVPKQRDIRNQQGWGRNKKRKPLEMVCLIPELCFMTGLTDDMRQDFRVMKDIAVHTRVPPAKRREELCKLALNLNQNPAARAELDKWGLSIDEDIMKIQGRLLLPEKIRLQGHDVSAGAEGDWSRELSRAHVLTPVHLTHWLLVVTSRDQGKAAEFSDMYRKCAHDMGITVGNPQVSVVNNDRTDTYLAAIREHLSPQVQLVMTIFPTSRDDRYNAIKRLCCADSPVPSQVINCRTIAQPQKLRSVTQKIALQINCKLGGELWGVNLPTKGLMVCGIDSYHEGAQKANSVGGFVSSVNETCTRWYSRVCMQMRGEELMSGLKICFLASLRKYHEVNHTLPKYIFIFRDGVGDGQLSYVKNFEVPQLCDCFPDFGDYAPKIAFVVVQKRINQRIFALKGRGPNPQMDNPGPGTVVDHTITRRQWDDFFLISQHVRQGTVSPTHYIVIYDTTGRGIDSIQGITYKMTHMYYNWPGTVRVPAPCQYAHKLAYLIGQNVRKEPSELLSDRLFFL